MKYSIPQLLIIVCTSLLTAGCWSPKKAKKIFHDQCQQGPFDALIVPGVPFNGENWDTLMMARVHWAKYLFEENLANNIIFSGSAVYTQYYEGAIMREYAIALGLPPENLFAETKAEHSVENVYYSILMGRKLGFEKFALATDPYQNYFMRQVFEDEIDYLYFLPFHYDIMETLEMTSPDIRVTHAVNHEFVPLPEREGFIKRWRGTTGRKVDFDKLKKE